MIYVTVMRKSEGDITCQTLYHCCIHSHTKTYPDKAVEREKEEDSGFATVARGQQQDETGRTRLANMATRGQEEDTRRIDSTRGRQQQEDSRRIRRGQQEDNTGTQGSGAAGQRLWPTSFVLFS